MSSENILQEWRGNQDILRLRKTKNLLPEDLSSLKKKKKLNKILLREMIKVESLENHKRKKDMMGEKVGK